MPDNPLQQAVSFMRSATSTVALTGAGISTPSGIPDFRSPGSGLWNVLDPISTASILAFHKYPQAFIQWFLPLARTIRAARPNPAHLALVALEQMGLLDLVITQNIDGLHQQAGSQQIIELHGHLRSASCLDCAYQQPMDALWPHLDQGWVIRCPSCGGLVKPDVTLFGEPLVYESLRAAQQAALTCDLMLVVGSSLEVEPAADLPYLARRRGARIILVDRQPAPADQVAHVVLRGDIAKILPKLVRACGFHP